MASIRKEFRKNTQFSANIFVDNVSVVSLDASFSLERTLSGCRRGV